MRRTTFTTMLVLVIFAAMAWLMGRRHAGPTTLSAQPKGVVDSARPRDVELSEFRQGLTPTDSLTYGRTGREELVQAFVTALEKRDTTVLRRLVLSKDEFAYVYYPTNPQALPPYDLSPELYWFTMETRSRQGLAHALAERAGAPLHYRSSRCIGEASVEGENRVYGPCVVLRSPAHGATIEERLFGPIIERRGRWKFVSYANRLD